jgi:hypothetical protein
MSGEGEVVRVVPEPVDNFLGFGVFVVGESFDEEAAGDEGDAGEVLEAVAVDVLEDLVCGWFVVVVECGEEFEVEFADVVVVDDRVVVVVGHVGESRGGGW